MNRTCSRCGEVKDDSEFSARNRGKDGLSPSCKACDRVYDRARYVKKRRQILDVSAARLAANREFINELKRGPCTDCGGRFHPVAMDWDHIGEDKIAGVAKLVHSTKEKILAEIAKCELVCANCHRVRTFNRKQFGRIRIVEEVAS